MLPRLVLFVAVFGFALIASPVQAVPVYFTIDQCAEGDCASFEASGEGAIVAQLDVINGNDLMITLTNDLNATADGDDPYLTSIGFEYGRLLEGLTFDSFTVLSGTVSTPTFTVNSFIRSFHIDFGFRFTDERDNRFQAANPNEAVQMIVGTTGDVDLSQFFLGVAKIGGAGTAGLSNPIVLTGTPSPTHSVPEPTSLTLVGLGLAAYGWRRSRPRL